MKLYLASRGPCTAVQRRTPPPRPQRGRTGRARRSRPGLGTRPTRQARARAGGRTGPRTRTLRLKTFKIDSSERPHSKTLPNTLFFRMPLLVY